MSFALDNKHRKVVPRWRAFKATAARGELAPTTRRESALSQLDSADEFVDSKVADWTRHKSAAFASDLVATALSVGSRHREAVNAAEHLLASPIVLTAAKLVATRFLGHAAGSALGTAQDVAHDESQALHREAIRGLKEHLRDNPRDAIARVDLSLHYTALGLVKPALKAMEVALRLAPDNRFLLRSAARLLVHHGDPDTALDILRSSARSRHDPWLAAAEIAVAGVAERSPLFTKSGSRLLEGGGAFQTAELASAIATLQGESGNLKSARKLFARSLIEPTENAVAQALWAQDALDASLVTAAVLKTPGSFEARALSAQRAGDLTSAVRQTWNWLFDQSFSLAAPIFGSYVAAVGLADFEEALRFLTIGRKANPGNWLLLNNLAFTLASLDRVAEAEEHLSEARLHAAGPHALATILATEGLLLFRKGEITGRTFYLDAIEAFRRLSQPKAAAIAAVFLAREEIRMETAESGVAVERARDLVGSSTEPEVIGAYLRVAGQFEDLKTKPGLPRPRS